MLNVHFDKKESQQELISNFVRIFYGDFSYEIIKYLFKNERAEEHKLALDLNVGFNQIRKELLLLEKHLILTS